jgi:hypothetical protein
MQHDVQNAEHLALPTANCGCPYGFPFKFWAAAHHTRNSGARAINTYCTYSEQAFFLFNILYLLHFSFHICCHKFQTGKFLTWNTQLLPTSNLYMKSITMYVK